MMFMDQEATTRGGSRAKPPPFLSSVHLQSDITIAATAQLTRTTVFSSIGPQAATNSNKLVRRGHGCTPATSQLRRVSSNGSNCSAHDKASERYQLPASHRHAAATSAAYHDAARRGVAGKLHTTTPWSRPRCLAGAGFGRRHNQQQQEVTGHTARHAGACRAWVITQLPHTNITTCYQPARP